MGFQKKKQDPYAPKISKKVKRSFRSKGKGFPRARRPRNLTEVKPKWGYYERVPFDSFMEVIYYRYVKYALKKSILRNLEMYLTYTDNTGKVHRFYPDFIVDGKYLVEVKGNFTEADIEKQRQNPSVKFITAKDIPKIKRVMVLKGVGFAENTFPLSSS